MSTNINRQIVIDVETTGLSPKVGHRIIEIAAVEILNRKVTGRKFHKFINPERNIDPEAHKIHGISIERLAKEPLFAEIADNFIDFIKNSELIIHNAPFDVGFINAEFARIDKAPLSSICNIFDTLLLAKSVRPKKSNKLIDLCKSYGISFKNRVLHSAIDDAELLLEVYLCMTNAQFSLFDDDPKIENNVLPKLEGLERDLLLRPLRIIKATPKEMDEHESIMNEIMNEISIRD